MCSVCVTRHSTLFGGPSQSDPADPRGPIQMAQRLAEANDGIEHPNQYTNELVMAYL